MYVADYIWLYTGIKRASHLNMFPCWAEILQALTSQFSLLADFFGGQVPIL